MLEVCILKDLIITEKMTEPREGYLNPEFLFNCIKQHQLNLQIGELTPGMLSNTKYTVHHSR